MAYKNSGAMKFNDATDLVIRADPNGTVESCYNRADNIEYINAYSNPSNITVNITNNASSSVQVYYSKVGSDGIIYSYVRSIVSGATVTDTYMMATKLRLTSASFDWNVVSGDVTIDTIYAVINSACTLTVEDA